LAARFPTSFEDGCKRNAGRRKLHMRLRFRLRNWYFYSALCHQFSLSFDSHSQRGFASSEVSAREDLFSALMMPRLTSGLQGLPSLTEISSLFNSFPIPYHPLTVACWDSVHNFATSIWGERLHIAKRRTPDCEIWRLDLLMQCAHSMVCTLSEVTATIYHLQLRLIRWLFPQAQNSVAMKSARR